MPEQTIASADGTKLSARVSGDGSPMVLVHGTPASKDTWAFVEPQLAQHHEVWAYDRRGRGQSDLGDDGYTLRSEVDDVLAVLDAAGGGAHLVSHSFGSVCALEAAVSGADIASLTIYEPPVHARLAQDIADRTLRQLRDGDREDALVTFLGGIAFSAEELELVRSIPEVWGRYLDAASTVPREIEALNDFTWDPARYRRIEAPTLLLAGEFTESPVFATRRELKEAIPHAEEHVFTGQRHIALATDAQRFAETVLRFTAQK